MSNYIFRLFWRLSATSILAVYVALRPHFDLYGSLLSELIWLTFSLVVGFSKIYNWRLIAPFRAYEDTWGFGQLLPLLLLLLPIVSLPEIYSGECHRSPRVQEPRIMLTFISASKHPDWDDSPDLNQNKSHHISHIELPRNFSFPMYHLAGTTESRVGQAMQAPKNSGPKSLTPSLLISSVPWLQQNASYETSFSEIARHSDCGTPPLSCSVSDDALVPQLATRSDLPSSCFVSNATFPQQMVSQNGSAVYPEQAGASARSSVFSDADFLYTSPAFKFLIPLDVIAFATPFIFTLIDTWFGRLSAGNIVLSSWQVWLLIIFGPRLVWLSTMMFLSRITKR